MPEDDALDERSRRAAPTRCSGTSRSRERRARVVSGRRRRARPKRLPCRSSRADRGIGDERREDDQPLDRLLPERADAEETSAPGRSCRAAATPISVPSTVPRPPVIAVPPTTTAAIACSSSPRRVARHRGEPHRVRASPPARPARPSATNTPKIDAPRLDAGEPRRLGVGADGVDASGRPAGCAAPRRTTASTTSAMTTISVCAAPGESPNHWKPPAGRAPTRPRRPAQRVAPGDQHRQRHDDRRQAEPADEEPLTAPIAAPTHDTTSGTSGDRQPGLRQQAGADAAHANCEPTEMSICRRG